MTLRLSPRPALPLLLAAACAAALPIEAQQLIGYVNTRDADITGASDVLDGQAVLTGAASITAKDHTAPITLGRGGVVRVCQTSVLRVTESRAVVVAAPLLFSLDRGAIELQMNGTPSDAIMTPDMRFTVRSAGPLDLRLRVARNGDTCVENRGPVAPTLAVTDPFGEAMYEIAPGQHILFEHGSLHEVVDRETSPCGCPEFKGVSVADALLASGSPKPAASAPPAATPLAAVQPAPPPPVVQTTPAVVVQTPPPAVVPPPVVVRTPPPAVAPPPVVVRTQPPAVVRTQPPAVVSPAAAAPAPAASAPAQPPPVRAAAVQAPVQPPSMPIAPVQAPAQPPDLATLQATEQAAEQVAAQAAIQAAERSATQTAAQAAESHPFPAAISEGLEPPAEAPPPPPATSQPHGLISDTLSYNAPIPAAPAAPAPAPAAASHAQKAPAAEPAPVAPAKAARPPSPPAHDLVSFFGSLFRKLFGRG